MLERRCIFRVPSIVLTVFTLFVIVPASAQQTPPVLPKIQETPLPPPVELPAPPGAPSEVASRPLTADEAGRIALARQPNIFAAQGNLVSAKGLERQAKSDLLPNVSVGATFSRSTSVAGARTTVGGVPTVAGTSSVASIDVNQLIYDFNHTRDLVRQAAALQRSAGANLTRVQADTVLQVKQAFYTYAQNVRLVGVNEANVKNQQSHLDLAQARLKAGMGLPADVVRAQTAVADAIFTLNQARDNASVSRVTLAELMGIDPRTPIELAESGESEPKVEDPNALVDLALRQRPEMIQEQALVQAAQHGLSAAKTSNAPVFGADLGLVQRGENFPSDSGAVTFGVSMAFDVFDSGYTAGRITEAKGNLQSAQAQLESTRLAVISDVSQAYLNLKTAEQRLKTAAAEVANADEALRLVTGRYQAGLGTFLDVLDAQTAQVTANTNRVNAASAIDLARAALARAIGAGLPGREGNG